MERTYHKQEINMTEALMTRRKFKKGNDLTTPIRNNHTKNRQAKLE